jgi:hypothetical protein
MGIYLSGKELNRLAEGLGQAIDIVSCVVQVEAGARDGGLVEFPDQRLGAHMTGTQCDTCLVGELGDVVRVNPFYDK